MGKSWYVCSLRRFGHYESLWNANLCNFNVKVQVKDFMNKFIPIFHCETQISATFCRFCWMTWSGPSERMKMLGLVPTISWQISQPYSKLLFFWGGEVVRLFPTHQLAPTKIFDIPVPLTRLVNDGCFRISEFFGHEEGVGFLDTVTDKDKLDETSCSN